MKVNKDHQDYMLGLIYHQTFFKKLMIKFIKNVYSKKKLVKMNLKTLRKILLKINKRKYIFKKS